MDKKIPDQKIIKQLQAIYEEAFYRLLRIPNHPDLIENHRMATAALCAAGHVAGMGEEQIFRLLDEPLEKAMKRYMRAMTCSAEEAEMVVKAAMKTLDAVLGTKSGTDWRRMH